MKHEDKVIIYFGGYLGRQIYMVHFNLLRGRWKFMSLVHLDS